MVIDIHPYDLYEMLDKLPDSEEIYGQSNLRGDGILIVDGKEYRGTTKAPPVISELDFIKGKFRKASTTWAEKHAR